MLDSVGVIKDLYTLVPRKVVFGIVGGIAFLFIVAWFVNKKEIF